MAFIEVADTWQITMRFTASGLRPKTMGFYVRDEAYSQSVTRASLIASEVAGWASAELTPLYGAGLTLSNINVRDLSTEFSISYDLTTNIPGTNVQAGLPANVAFAISFRTGFAGRSYRGRVYHPWLGETDVSGNYLTVGTADDLVAAWEALDAQLLALDLLMVVVSRYANGAPRTAGITTRIQEYTYTDLNVDTQRRRVRPL